MDRGAAVGLPFPGPLPWSLAGALAAAGPGSARPEEAAGPGHGGLGQRGSTEAPP